MEGVESSKGETSEKEQRDLWLGRFCQREAARVVAAIGGGRLGGTRPGCRGTFDLKNGRTRELVQRLAMRGAIVALAQIAYHSAKTPAPSG